MSNNCSTIKISEFYNTSNLLCTNCIANNHSMGCQQSTITDVGCNGRPLDEDVIRSNTVKYQRPPELQWKSYMYPGLATPDFNRPHVPDSGAIVFHPTDCVHWRPSKNISVAIDFIYWIHMYRKPHNIWRTKSQNMNVARLVLRLSLCNLLKPGVKLRMKMQLEQRQQAMLQLHLSVKQFNGLLRCDLN